MSIVRSTIIAGVAAVLAAGSVLAAPGASAAPAPKGTAGLHAKLPAGKLAAVPTTNYGAGYFAYPGATNGVASASATFTMPAFNCVHANDQEWLLPGIWVYDTNGALTEQVDVNFNCNSNSKFQVGIICLGTSCDQTMVVNPGDRIQASIAYTSSATVGRLHNLTSGAVTQVVGAAVTNDYTVFIGDEGPNLFLSGAVTKVPSFTTVPFSVATVNGQYLGDWSPAHYNLKTQNSVQITSAALTAGGTAFVTKFQHS